MSVISTRSAAEFVLPEPPKRGRGRPRKSPVIPVTETRLSRQGSARRGSPRAHADNAPDGMVDAEFDDLACGLDVLLRCTNQD